MWKIFTVVDSFSMDVLTHPWIGWDVSTLALVCRVLDLASED